MCMALKYLTAKGVEAALENSGYRNCRFERVAFVRMTNSGQAMYQVELHRDDYDNVDDAIGAVYVRSENGELKGEF